MDRAGLTPAYAVEVRHKADLERSGRGRKPDRKGGTVRYAQQQVAQPQIEDAERMAREILQSLPTVMAVLQPDEVETVLKDLPPMT